MAAVRVTEMSLMSLMRSIFRPQAQELPPAPRDIERIQADREHSAEVHNMVKSRVREFDADMERRLRNLEAQADVLAPPERPRKVIKAERVN